MYLCVSVQLRICEFVYVCVRVFVNVCGAAVGLPRLWVVFKAQLCDPHPKGLL